MTEHPSLPQETSPIGASCELCEKPAVLCLMDTHGGPSFVFRCFCEEHGRVYTANGIHISESH